jgi:hypothetical protein
MFDQNGKLDVSHPEAERIDTFLLLQFEVTHLTRLPSGALTISCRCCI